MITLAEQSAEAQRERALSKPCYPQWIKSGKLRATKIGRRVLIRTDHIEAMLDANWKVSA